MRTQPNFLHVYYGACLIGIEITCEQNSTKQESLVLLILKSV